MRNTEVVVIKKGKKIDKEKKKKYDYSTNELYLERELNYKENTQDILENIKF